MSYRQVQKLLRIYTLNLTSRSQRFVYDVTGGLRAAQSGFVSHKESPQTKKYSVQAYQFKLLCTNTDTAKLVLML